jgi:hypothetical protein
MRTRSAALAACVVGVLGGLGSARADTVKLTNGREIRGSVEEETRERVVVKTRGGRVVFPRAVVASIVRESPAHTALEDALALAAAHDGKTTEAFERAIRLARDEGDEALAQRAQEARDAWSSSRAPTKGPLPTPAPSPTPSAPAPSDPSALLERLIAEAERDLAAKKPGAAERLAGFLLQRGVQRMESSPEPALADFERSRSVWSGVGFSDMEITLRRTLCGGAILSGKGPKALALIAPVIKANRGDAHDLYLYGRALLEARRETEAVSALLGVIGTAAGVNESTPIDLLIHLARRKVLGYPLGAPISGVGERWKRVERASIVIYHELSEGSEDLFGVFEQSRQRAVQRLGLPDPFKPGVSRPTLVFLYSSKIHFQEGGGIELSSGHAELDRLEDGLQGGAIATFAQRRLSGTFDHEFAHIVVDEYMAGRPLPAWLNEGAATFAQPARSQTRLRGEIARSGLKPVGLFLSGNVARGSDVAAVRDYYGQALVTFEALVGRAASASRVLDAASLLFEDKGPEKFVKKLGFSSLAELDQEFDRVLQSPARVAPGPDDGSDEDR